VSLWRRMAMEMLLPACPAPGEAEEIRNVLSLPALKGMADEIEGVLERPGPENRAEARRIRRQLLDLARSRRLTRSVMRNLIRKVKSPMGLWVELTDCFQEAHRDAEGKPLIRAVYDYARWCVCESRSDDVQSAAVVAFYEDLVLDKRVIEQIPYHMTRQEFLGLTDVFKYYLEPEQHKAFMEEMLSRRFLDDQAHEHSFGPS